MDRKELQILGACQRVMDRGIEIVPGAWRVRGSLNGGAYHHDDLRLCPLSALLIARNIPCVHGAIEDAAVALETTTGWVVGFCRGYDEYREHYAADRQWFKAKLCCPMDLAAGRRTGVYLRMIIERAERSAQAIRDVLENDRKVYEHSRARAQRLG